MSKGCDFCDATTTGNLTEQGWASATINVKDVGRVNIRCCDDDCGEEMDELLIYLCTLDSEYFRDFLIAWKDEGKFRIKLYDNTKHKSLRGWM